jgi:predicted nucleic acid-binding protein
VIVLDASALVDVVIGTSPGPWVLDRLEGEEVIAPAHQPAEVLSALVRLERSGRLTAAETADAIEDAMALRMTLEPLDRRLVNRAFALRESLRVLDALYVAVAERHDAVLVTTDARLARAEPPCHVQAPS